MFFGARTFTRRIGDCCSRLAWAAPRTAAWRSAPDRKANRLPKVEKTQSGQLGRIRILFCMINPNENDLTGDEPLPTPLQSGEQQIGPGGHEQFRRASSKFSTAMSPDLGIRQKRKQAGRGSEREYFVTAKIRADHPGRTGAGIAIGLAIRFCVYQRAKGGN